MNSNSPIEQPHNDDINDPEIIQSVTRKKEELLERLHRLSDRVKTLDSRAQEMPEPDAQVTVSKSQPIPKPQVTKEPIKTLHIPQQKQILRSQFEVAPIHQDEIQRNLKSIQGLLNNRRYLNEDYKKCIGQLNDIQSRTKLMCTKIDKAYELIRKLDSQGKYAPDSKNAMGHLFEQLGVCLHGKPAEQTLLLLREEYDMVVSPYLL